MKPGGAHCGTSNTHALSANPHHDCQKRQPAGRQEGDIPRTTNRTHPSPTWSRGTSVTATSGPCCPLAAASLSLLRLMRSAVLATWFSACSSTASRQGSARGHAQGVVVGVCEV